MIHHKKLQVGKKKRRKTKRRNTKRSKTKRRKTKRKNKSRKYHLNIKKGNHPDFHKNNQLGDVIIYKNVSF